MHTLTFDFYSSSITVRQNQIYPKLKFLLFNLIDNNRLASLTTCRSTSELWKLSLRSSTICPSLSETPQMPSLAPRRFMSTPNPALRFRWISLMAPNEPRTRKMLTKSRWRKIWNKLFGHLARCKGKFCTTTLKNKNFGSKWDENTDNDSAKIWNFVFWKNWNPENYEIITSALGKM